MENQNKNSSATKWLAIAIIVASVVISGTIIYTKNSGSSNSAEAIKQGSDTGAGQQPQVASSADISKVKIAGEPFIGNPGAKVVIAYWYDYQCPFCQRNEETAMPQIIKDYVDTGKIRVVFKDYQFLGQDSQTLGQFSRAVWAVAPDKFYSWHKAVYDNQGTENTGWATHEKIMSITTSVLGVANANKVDQLVKTNGSEYQKEMDADKAEGTSMGVNGTPGTVIGNQLISGAQPYPAFKQVIDLTLQGK